MNSEQKKYIKQKSERRENKKKDRRGATPEEVIYIFEKILEGWKTIRIYNTIIQTNSSSNVTKKIVENVSTGNSKVYQSEFTTQEMFNLYNELREKVYTYHKNIKLEKKEKQQEQKPIKP